MAIIMSRVDTAHTDAINDVQLNYHGTRMATCSSDRTIKIFDVKPNGQSYPVAELAGHIGPVWKLSWSHPRLLSLLASAGYDRRVIVWQESSPGQWLRFYEFAGHDASVNGIAFAPPQFGLILATASSDGSIAVLSFCLQTSQWSVARISKAHEQGVNAVSWAPPVQLAAFEGATDGSVIQKRFASCGNDKLIKIWMQNDPMGEWNQEHVLTAHTDFVRDVAWNPIVLHDTYTIASCGQDRTLLLWRARQDGSGGETTSKWSARLLEKAEGALWHVSWSLCGNILATSGDDNKITYWKENLQRDWIRIPEDSIRQ